MNARSKPAQVWGRRAAEFYEELEDELVLIAVRNGKMFKGHLVGVDVYDVIIRQESGLELLIPKGAIIYVHRVES
jgi:sRNA-binding regulator protein Hfq